MSWWNGLGLVMTIGVGWMPASYQPFIGQRRVIARLALASGIATIGGFAGGILASQIWSPTIGLSAATVTAGLVLLAHHAIWSVTARSLMFVWPGVAAAGIGLIFGFGALSASHPAVWAGFVLAFGGLGAMYLNVGARRPS